MLVMSDCMFSLWERHLGLVGDIGVGQGLGMSLRLRELRRAGADLLKTESYTIETSFIDFTRRATPPISVCCEYQQLLSGELFWDMSIKRSPSDIFSVMYRTVFWYIM